MAATHIKWRPGIEKGNPVNVLFTMPVNFTLEEKKGDEIDTGNQ